MAAVGVVAVVTAAVMAAAAKVAATAVAGKAVAGKAVAGKAEAMGLEPCTCCLRSRIPMRNWYSSHCLIRMLHTCCLPRHRYRTTGHRQ